MDVISVVIPVYNSERYLRECLDSVTGQTWRDLDVILVDDGSTDGSPGICREYAERDGRVRFFRPEPAGVGATRNYGITMAKGRFLMFVDSDDVCEPELAERLLAARTVRSPGEDVPPTLALCGMTVTDEKGKATGAFREDGVSVRIPVREYVRDVLAKWQSNPLCGGVYCKLFETDVLNRYGIRFEENETYAEDFLFNLAYLARVEEVTTLPDTLYRYRAGRSGSLTEENRKAADPEAVWARRLEVVRAYEAAFARCGLAEECAAEIRAFYLKNVTDVVEMAVKQGAKGKDFAAWMEPLRKGLGSDFSAAPGKYRVSLGMLKQGRYGLLRGYEAARRRLRMIRGRER